VATQIFDSNHPALPSRQAHAEFEAEFETEQSEPEQPGGIFIGLFYALLFDVFLVLLFVGAWELWRVLR